MGANTIVFLKQFASVGSFPACISKIRDTRTGELLFEQSVGQLPLDDRRPIIVQDVPGYLELEWTETQNKIKTRTLATQKTYVVNLDQYRDSDAYLQEHFGPKSRSALRRYKKRLEHCFRVEYQVHYGAMDLHGYDILFEQVRDLMERRFEQKRERNYELRHLDEIKKDVYPKLLEKQASIFVITANGRPISIRINLMRGTLAYYILSAYDPDYDIFRLGKLDMWQNIHWFMENGYKKYDLLKGYAYIKEQWADSKFENTQVLINRDSTPMGTLRFLLLFWRIRIPLVLVNLAKRLNLDKTLRRWKQNKKTDRESKEMDVRALDSGKDSPISGESLEFPTGLKSLDRSIIKLAYKHLYPVDGILVHKIGAAPDRYRAQLGNQVYLLKV